MGNVPIGNLVATNVQNALNELQSEVDTTIKVVADEVRINN